MFDFPRPKPMPKLPLFSLAVLLLGSLLLPSASLADRGAKAAPFRLPAISGVENGADFNLEDHLGKDPIVIIFWATYCKPCKEQLPFYQKLAKHFKKRGLKVVAIAMDGPETISRVASTVKRLKLKYPVLSDLDTAVSARLNPRKSAPFTIWINRDGRIVREIEGFTLAERDDIAKGVAKLTKKKKKK